MIKAYHRQHGKTADIIQFAYGSNLDLIEQNILGEIKCIEQNSDIINDDLKPILRNLRNINPFVEDITIFLYDGKGGYTYAVGTNNTGYIDNLKEDSIRMALESNKTQELNYTNDEGHTETTKYIPYLPEHGDKNKGLYVTEVIYSDRIIVNEISFRKKTFIQNVIILSTFYFGFAVIFLLDKNHKIAHQDPLTKLPNRKGFRQIMENKILQANKEGFKLVVLYFDLDGFKEINDTFGHSLGDEVLRGVARRLEEGISKDNFVSRLGGDEFISIISGKDRELDAQQIGEDMSALFDPPLLLDKQEVDIKASIGISIYPDHGETLDDLVNKADQAMYKSKDEKKKYIIYER